MTLTTEPAQGLSGWIAIAAGAVFRLESPDETSPRRWILPLLLVSGAAVSLLRQAGTNAVLTVYAEDGDVFLQEALRFPVADTLLRPFAGYVHLVPRLVAEAAASLPVGLASWVFAVAAASLVGAIAVFTYRASRAYVNSPAVRVLLSATVVAVPVGQEEVLNTAANLHWFMMFAALWSVLWWPSSRVAMVVSAVVAFLSAASDPMTAVLLPIAGARPFLERTWRAAGPLIGLMAGMSLQLPALLSGATGERALGTSFGPVEVLVRYAYHVLVRGIVGTRLAPGDPDFEVLVVAFVLLGAVGLLAWRTYRTLALGPIVGSMYASIAFFVVPVTLTGLVPPRYSVPPVLAFLCAIALVLDAGMSSRRRSTAGLTWAVLAIVALMLVVNLPARNSRSSAPRWDVALAVATEGCAGPEDVAEVQLAPPERRMTLACSELLGR